MHRQLLAKWLDEAENAKETADETAEPLGAGGYESTAPAAHVSGAERQQPVIDDI